VQDDGQDGIKTGKDSKYADLIARTRHIRWKPGQSGNPTGTPKIKTLHKAYLDGWTETAPAVGGLTRR
jgi:hypothetical protein